MENTIYIGMDVHKDSYSLCCYCFDRDKVEYQQTIQADYRLILKYIERMRKNYGSDSEFICGYEAGCLGYSLYHQLTDHAINCVILAPTTMAVTNTNRVKTDRKDAANIARCLAFHTYSAVYVPDEEDNAVKEYLRMRNESWFCSCSTALGGNDCLGCLADKTPRSLTGTTIKSWRLKK